MRSELFSWREVCLFCLAAICAIVAIIPSDYQLGRSFYLSYEFENAYKYLSKASPSQHNDPQILISIADYFEKIGDNKKAAELWEQVVILLPKGQEAYKKLIKLLEWSGDELRSLSYQIKLAELSSEEDKENIIIDVARKFSYYRKFDQAKVEFEKLLNSKDDSVIQEASDFFCRVSDIKKCIEGLKKLQEVKFQISREENLFLLYLSEDERNKALESLKSVMSKMPFASWDDVMAADPEKILDKMHLFKMMLDKTTAQRKAELEGVYNKLFEKMINNHNFVFDYFEYTKRNNPTELVKRLDFFFSNSKMAHLKALELSQYYRSEKQLQKAIEVLETAITKQEKRLEILEELSDLYEETGQDQKAIKILQEILVKKKKNKLNMLRPETRRSLASEKQDHKIEIKLARLFLKNHQWNELDDLLKQVLDKDPDILGNEEWWPILFYGPQTINPELSLRVANEILQKNDQSELYRDALLYSIESYRSQQKPEAIVKLIGQLDLNPNNDYFLFTQRLWAYRELKNFQLLKINCAELLAKGTLDEKYYYDSIECLERFKKTDRELVDYLERYHSKNGFGVESFDMLFDQYLVLDDLKSAKNILQKKKLQFPNDSRLSEQENYLKYKEQLEADELKSIAGLALRSYQADGFRTETKNVKAETPIFSLRCKNIYSRTDIAQEGDLISDNLEVGCSKNLTDKGFYWYAGSNIFLQEHEQNKYLPVFIESAYQVNQNVQVRLNWRNLNRDLDNAQAQQFMAPFYRQYQFALASQHRDFSGSLELELKRPLDSMGGGEIWRYNGFGEYRPIPSIPLSLWSDIVVEQIDHNTGAYATFYEDSSKLLIGPGSLFKDKLGNELSVKYGLGRRFDSHADFDSERALIVNGSLKVSELGLVNVGVVQSRVTSFGETVESFDLNLNLQQYF